MLGIGPFVIMGRRLYRSTAMPMANLIPDLHHQGLFNMQFISNRFLNNSNYQQPAQLPLILPNDAPSQASVTVSTLQALKKNSSNTQYTVNRKDQQTAVFKEAAMQTFQFNGGGSKYEGTSAQEDRRNSKVNFIRFRQRSTDFDVHNLDFLDGTLNKREIMPIPRGSSQVIELSQFGCGGYLLEDLAYTQIPYCIICSHFQQLRTPAPRKSSTTLFRSLSRMLR